MIVHCAHREMVPLDKLVPNPKNPNEHPDEQVALLARIMEFQGVRNPIVVSNRSGFMTKGHGRLMAARMNQWTEFPVDYQDYESEAQEYADMVADNKIAELAESDMAMIYRDAAEILGEVSTDMLGIPDFEFPEPELEPQCDEDELPEHVETRSKLGDLWQLGRHRLLCGDATNLSDLDRLMGGELVQLIVTDPPYNVAYEGKTKDALTIENDSMDDSSFYKFLYDAYVSMFTAADDGCGIYVFHADSEGANFRKALVDAGFKLAQCCIWVKNSIVMGRQDYHWKHEPILYGWKPTAAHHWYTDRKQSTVWDFARPSRNAEHPTMKPVEIIQYALGNSSKPKDKVLDLFGGSGSTLIACEKTHRACFMMELDPKYCDVILSRWERYTGNTAQCISDTSAKTGE